MEIRRRTPADLDRCVAIAERTKRLDDYPKLDGVDLRAFLVRTDALGAWVADVDGAVAGHVALHATSTDAVMALATGVTDREPSAFGVVARLLVDPDRRRLGLGRALLDTAAGAARRLGRWPMLDVAVAHETAVVMYDRLGWRRIGTVTSTFFGGQALDEYVYLAPGTPEPDVPPG